MQRIRYNLMHFDTILMVFDAFSIVIRYINRSKFRNIIRCYFIQYFNINASMRSTSKIASNYYRNASNYISKFWPIKVLNSHRKCMEYHRNCIEISIEMHRIISNSLWIEYLFSVMIVIEPHRKCIEISMYYRAVVGIFSKST